MAFHGCCLTSARLQQSMQTSSKPTPTLATRRTFTLVGGFIASGTNVGTLTFTNTSKGTTSSCTPPQGYGFRTCTLATAISVGVGENYTVSSTGSVEIMRLDNPQRIMFLRVGTPTGELRSFQANAAPGTNAKDVPNLWAGPVSANFPGGGDLGGADGGIGTDGGASGGRPDGGGAGGEGAAGAGTGGAGAGGRTGTAGAGGASLTGGNAGASTGGSGGASTGGTGGASTAGGGGGADAGSSLTGVQVDDRRAARRAMAGGALREAAHRMRMAAVVAWRMRVARVIRGGSHSVSPWRLVEEGDDPLSAVGLAHAVERR